MLQISKDTKHPDIALEPEDIEVSVLNNVIVFPPVTKLAVGKTLNTSIKGLSNLIPHEGDVTKKIVEKELHSLLLLKTRFGNSSSYLLKISALYQVADHHVLAIEYAEAASKLNTSALYRQRLAEAYLKGGREGEALEIFKNLRSEGYIDAHLRLAEFAINSQHLDEAKNIVDQALSLDELDWKSRLVAGGLALAKNEFERAIRHYRVAVAERPTSSILRLNIAISHYLLGNTKKALKDAQKAISLSPFNTKALYFLADLTLQESNKSNLAPIHKLQRYLETYFSLMPRDNGLVGRLADVYLMQDKIKEGIELLEENKEEIKDPAIWNNLGVFWANRKKEVAAKYYQKAIEIVGSIENATQNRGASFAVLNLANLLISNQNYKQAQKILETYIGSANSTDYLEDGDLWKIPLSLINAYISQDMIEKGLALANQLLENSNIHVLGRIDLLTMLTSYHSLVTFDYEQNLVFAERALNFVREHIDEVPKRVYMMVINNLVCAYIDSGNMDEAKAWIDQLRVDYGSEEYIYATKGLFSLHMGHIEQARSYYEKAIALAEDKERKSAIKVKMNYELGKFFLNQQKWTRAQLHLKKVLQTKDARDGWSFKSLQQLALNLLSNIQKQSFYR